MPSGIRRGLERLTDYNHFLLIPGLENCCCCCCLEIVNWTMRSCCCCLESVDRTGRSCCCCCLVEMVILREMSCGLGRVKGCHYSENWIRAQRMLALMRRRLFDCCPPILVSRWRLCWRSCHRLRPGHRKQAGGQHAHTACVAT